MTTLTTRMTEAGRMAHNIRRKRTISKLVAHGLLLASSLLIAFPFIWMATRALMTPEELKLSRFQLIPSTIQWTNFIEFWQAEPLFPRYFMNSAIMALGVLILQMTVACLASYAFTFIRFPGRNLFFFIAISTLMIPVVVTYVPSYIILSDMPVWLRVAWSLLLSSSGLVVLWMILRTLERVITGVLGRESHLLSIAWRGIVLAGALTWFISDGLPAMRAGPAVPFWAAMSLMLVVFLIFELGEHLFSWFPGDKVALPVSIWRLILLGGILIFMAIQGPGWLGDNWLDTYQGLIIPSAVSAFGIFLFRQGFSSLPKDLIDAGKIDGASHLRMLTEIVLPLNKPILITFVIFTLVLYYNSYFWPLLITNRATMRVLTIGLQIFFIEKGYYGIRWHLIMAANTVAVAPLLIVFFVLQRWFIEGVATTGLKG